MAFALLATGFHVRIALIQNHKLLRDGKGCLGTFT
jgi:hypothetical protein